MGVRLASPSRLHLRNGGLALATGVAVAAPAPGTPATSIALAEPLKDRHVFQRVGTSKAVPVTVNFTGSPSLIQARSIDEATGNPVTAWATIATSPSGTSCTGSITVPQGSWSKIQVTDGTTIVTGTKRFAVGARFATIGQSNMYFLGTSGTGIYPLSDKRTAAYIASAFKLLGNQKAGFAPGTPFGGAGGYGDGSTVESGTFQGDGLIRMANRLADQLGCVVLFLHYAVTGSSIEQWQTGGNCWEPFKTAALEIDGDFEQATWLQGENNTGTSMATYKVNLGNLLGNLWALTGRGASNFRLGVVGLGPAINYFGAEGNGGLVRKTQLEFVAENAANGVYYSSTAHDADLNGDNVHFTAFSHVRQGYRYAQGILVPGSVAGPKITGATRSGTTITVNVQHNRGTALLDGAGGNGSALLGWRVFDNGVQMAAPTTAIFGNAIRLTLASTPTGPVTLDYCMTNLPFGSTRNLASVVYDNDTVPGDTLGLPLQPCTVINVTGG
jgi:hypothetical protein